MPPGPGDRALVTEADLAPLPGTARRYLRRAGVIGQPRDWSFRMESTGRFRMRPDGRWMTCRAWQYDSRLTIGRVFLMTMRVGGLVPMIARDTYLGGHGRMVGKVLDLFTVADGRGPELDAGELVTWLNDAVLFAPSMLLGPGIAWSEVDGRSFDVSLTDRGLTVRARVTVDERGAPVDFGTTDRFWYVPDRPGARWIRALWTTPTDGWSIVNGRWLPTSARAVWHLPEGPFVYAEFRPRLETLAFNVSPSD
jgi:hypothetical protein